MYREIWNWNRCKDKIETLRGRLGFPDASVLKFLGLRLFLKDGLIYDDLRQKTIPKIEPSVYCILFGYANAHPVAEARKLISPVKLWRGHPYQGAFTQRGARPLARVASSEVSLLHQAASSRETKS